jgi:hypothetical protein
MMELSTAVIFEAPFRGEPGHGVLFYEHEDAAQAVRDELEGAGFGAVVRGGAEGPRRFWYLLSNAPIGEIWCRIAAFFDAYIRFEVGPDGRLQVRESCPCEGCREPIGSERHRRSLALGPDPEEPRLGQLPGPDFDRPVLN